MPERRNHRLPEVEYIGRKIVQFTACEIARRPLFANEQVFAVVQEKLAEGCARHRCSVPIFTVMPDHVHVLVLGDEEDSHTVKAFDTFKRLSGTAFTQLAKAPKWQPRSHDEVLRDGALSGKARYIARNPYRAGLCEPNERWPYTGSIGHDLDEIILDAFW